MTNLTLNSTRAADNVRNDLGTQYLSAMCAAAPTAAAPAAAPADTSAAAPTATNAAAAVASPYVAQAGQRPGRGRSWQVVEGGEREEAVEVPAGPGRRDY